MRSGFVTAVQLGLACLDEIYDAGGSIDHLFTLQDDVEPDKSGRVFLDGFAASHAVPCTKVRDINDAVAVSALRAADLDWLYIIGWSQIAHADVLETPRRGAIGMHPTLLPEGRGRASIPWAILKGLDRTGVTAFELDQGVDTGPIVAQHPIDIDHDETAATLYAKVERAHRSLIRRIHPLLASGSVPTHPQDESRATRWPGRRPADGEVLPTMTVAEVDRLVRATTRPYPGAFTRLTDGTAITIWAGSTSRLHDADLEVGCADGTYWATDTSIR